MNNVNKYNILELHLLLLIVNTWWITSERGSWVGLLWFQNPTLLICRFHNPRSGISSFAICIFDCKVIKIRKSVFVPSNLLFMFSSFLHVYHSHTFVSAHVYPWPLFVLPYVCALPNAHVCIAVYNLSCPTSICPPFVLIFVSLSHVCPVLFCLIVLGDHHELASEMKGIVDKTFYFWKLYILSL